MFQPQGFLIPFGNPLTLKKKCHLIYISLGTVPKNIIQKTSPPPPPRKSPHHPRSQKKTSSEFKLWNAVVHRSSGAETPPLWPSFLPLFLLQLLRATCRQCSAEEYLKSSGKIRVRNDKCMETWSHFKYLISPDIQIFEKKNAATLVKYLQSFQKGVGWKRWGGGLMNTCYLMFFLQWNSQWIWLKWFLLELWNSRRHWKPPKGTSNKNCTYQDIYTWQMFHCYDSLYTEKGWMLWWLWFRSKGKEFSSGLVFYPTPINPPTQWQGFKASPSQN